MCLFTGHIRFQPPSAVWYQRKDFLDIIIMVTGQNPPGHVTPGHLPQGHISPGHLPPGHLPPGHLPLGHIPPGHLPPGHLSPGHLPPRTYTPQTYTPQTLKGPIWFMHHDCVDYLLHFKKHLFCRNSIYL